MLTCFLYAQLMPIQIVTAMPAIACLAVMTDAKVHLGAYLLRSYSPGA